MRRNSFTRITAIILAICMLAGIAVGIFAIFPWLLPFIFAAGVAGYLFYRYKSKKS